MKSISFFMTKIILKYALSSRHIQCIWQCYLFGCSKRVSYRPTIDINVKKILCLTYFLIFNSLKYPIKCIWSKQWPTSNFKMEKVIQPRFIKTSWIHVQLLIFRIFCNNFYLFLLRLWHKRVRNSNKSSYDPLKI